MSALTDLFTSLANKIRNKLGTTSTYTPAQAIAAIDDVYNKGISDTKKGNAAVEDVLASKTFTSNIAGVNQTGAMTNNGAVSPSGLNCGGSYTIPAGYHNGSGKVTANSLASQTGVDSRKSAVTAGTMVSGYQGWVNGTKVTGTFTAQPGSASPSTSSQTKYPDSGKYFSSFTVSAISPQQSNGTAASASGVDSTGPYVYFPYGWWPSHSSSRSYTYLTTAQAKAVHKHTDTWTPSSSQYNSSGADMGEYHSNRKVNTAVCYTAGQKYGGSLINFIANNRVSIYQNSYSFSFTAKQGYAYTVVVVLWQTSGTYTGVGSGANMTCSGASSSFIGSTPSWVQEEARSAQTSGNGGMVMRITGVIKCSAAGTVNVSANWKTTVSGALWYMVTGLP